MLGTNTLAVSQEQLGHLLKVTSRSVARWEKEGVEPKKQEQRARLERLQEIVNLGRKIYSEDGLNEFLSTPFTIFEGQTGYDMISIGKYDVVIGALAADYEGVGF